MLIKEDIPDNPIIYEMKENVKKSNRKTLKISTSYFNYLNK